MEHFIKAFKPAHGGWVCVVPATLELPTGRVQVTRGQFFVPGEKFMNVDVASLLDQQYAKTHQRH